MAEEIKRRHLILSIDWFVNSGHAVTGGVTGWVAFRFLEMEKDYPLIRTTKNCFLWKITH